LEEIDDDKKDEMVQNLHLDGYALGTPLGWLQRPYKLTMYVLCGSDERCGLNVEAMAIFNRLDNAGDGVVRNRYMAQPIYGTVIICNEDDDGVEDFTLDDYRFVLNKVYDY
jgi:hypothetical protein